MAHRDDNDPERPAPPWWIEHVMAGYR